MLLKSYDSNYRDISSLWFSQFRQRLSWSRQLCMYAHFCQIPEYERYVRISNTFHYMIHIDPLRDWATDFTILFYFPMHLVCFFRFQRSATKFKYMYLTMHFHKKIILASPMDLNHLHNSETLNIYNVLSVLQHLGTLNCQIFSMF